MKVYAATIFRSKLLQILIQQKCKWVPAKAVPLLSSIYAEVPTKLPSEVPLRITLEIAAGLLFTKPFKKCTRNSPENFSRAISTSSSSGYFEEHFL